MHPISCPVCVRTHGPASIREAGRAGHFSSWLLSPVRHAICGQSEDSSDDSSELSAYQTRVRRSRELFLRAERSSNLCSLRTVVRDSEDAPTIIEALSVCPLCALTLGLSIYMGRDASCRSIFVALLPSGADTTWCGYCCPLMYADGVVQYFAVARCAVPVLFESVFWLFLNYGSAPGPSGDRGEMAMADGRLCAVCAFAAYVRHFPLVREAPGHNRWGVAETPLPVKPQGRNVDRLCNLLPQVPLQSGFQMSLREV